MVDHPPSDHDSEDEVPIKLQGPFSRNRWLIVALLAAFVVGPWFSRFIEEYRVIVLAMDDGEMLVARPHLSPEKMSAVEAKPGDIVAKERFDWSPRVVERQLGDKKIIDLYERYVDTYQGRVIKIRDPLRPGGPHVAVVKLDRGGKVSVPLWDDGLASAEVGSFVVKYPHTWTPVIEDDRGTVRPAQPSELPADGSTAIEGSASPEPQNAKPQDPAPVP